MAARSEPAVLQSGAAAAASAPGRLGRGWHVVTSAAGAEAVDVNMLRIRSAGVISLIVEIKQSEESFWLMCVVVAVAWRGVVLMSLVCASSLLHHPFRIIIN